MDKKHTPSGLPVVRRELIEAKISDWNRKEKYRFNFLDELTRIEAENPYIANIIQNLMEASQDPKNVGVATITIYKLLEEQLQAYKLEENK